MDGLPLRVGLFGEDSREGIGEFVADAARLGWNRFVDAAFVEEESRTGLGVFGVVRSRVGILVVSMWSAVSCVALDADEDVGFCLSSMVVAVLTVTKMDAVVEGANSNHAATSQKGRWTPGSLALLGASNVLGAGRTSVCVFSVGTRRGTMDPSKRDGRDLACAKKQRKTAKGVGAGGGVWVRLEGEDLGAAS